MVYSLSSRRVKAWLTKQNYMHQAEQFDEALEAYIFVPDSGLKWEKFGGYALVQLPAVRNSSGPPSCTMNPAPFESFRASLLFVREHDGWKLDNLLPVDGLELPDLNFLLKEAPQKIRAGEILPLPYFSWWAEAILEAIDNAKFPSEKIADVLMNALMLRHFGIFEKTLKILAGKDPNYCPPSEEGIMVVACLGMFRDRRVLPTYLQYLTADFPHLGLCISHMRSMLPEKAPPISDAKLLMWLAHNLPYLDWDEESLRFILKTTVQKPIGSPEQIQRWRVKLRRLAKIVGRSK